MVTQPLTQESNPGPPHGGATDLPRVRVLAALNTAQLAVLLLRINPI